MDDDWKDDVEVMAIIEIIVSRAMAAADRSVRCVGCAIIFIIFCDVIVSLDVKRQLCLRLLWFSRDIAVITLIIWALQKMINLLSAAPTYYYY